jgi:hypothetical protein
VQNKQTAIFLVGNLYSRSVSTPPSKKDQTCSATVTKKTLIGKFLFGYRKVRNAKCSAFRSRKGRATEATGTKQRAGL